MKNWISLLALLLLMSLFFSGCSNADSSEQQQSDLLEEHVSDEDEQKFNKVAEVSIYSGHMADFSGRLSDNLGDFLDNNGEISRDITLLYDDDWIDKTASNIVELKFLIEEYREISPPVEFQKSYDLMSLALDEYEFIVKDYAVALDELDSDKLADVVSHVQKGSDYIDQAGEQLKLDSDAAGF